MHIFETRDPRAPNLFLLIGKISNTLLKIAHDIGIIKGLHVPFHADPIILFHYADDTIIFVKNDP